MKTFRGGEERECRTTPVDLCFINEDILMITTDVEGLFFYDIALRKWIAHLAPKSQRNLYKSSVVLSISHARICTGGNAGYCRIFSPPANVAVSLVKRVGGLKSARLKNEIKQAKSKVAKLKLEKSVDSIKMGKMRS